MLQKETLVPEMINLLKELQSNFKEHILAGGTALTLQLGHRTSTDIDLFTNKKQNKLEIMEHLRKNYKKIKIDTANDEFIRAYNFSGFLIS